MSKDSSRNPPPDPFEDDEARLFRESVGDVRPVNGDDRVRHHRRPPPDPTQTRHSEDRVRHELLDHAGGDEGVETGEELAWVRSDLPARYLKRLRRGHYSIGAELDLHQMNREAARTSVHDFLDECGRRRILCARIVHGKGLRSRSSGPVLKGLVNSLLRRRKDVVAFVSAPANDGGTGAVYVLLQRR